MKFVSILLLLFSSLQYVRSQDVRIILHLKSHRHFIFQCKPQDKLPDLPSFYSANLQYNIINKERLRLGKCRFSGGPCPSPGEGDGVRRSPGEGEGVRRPPPIHDMGHSMAMSEIFDGSQEASKIMFSVEFQSGNGSESFMANTFIWNQALSGSKNFIEILDFEGSKCWLYSNWHHVFI